MKQLSKQAMESIAGGLAADGPIEVSRAELGALAAAIGSGAGASYAIESAGGLSAMGNGAIAAGGAAFSGVLASGAAGYLAGSYLYNHSETVQNAAIEAVGYVVESYNSVVEGMHFDVNTEFGATIGEHSCTAAGSDIVNLLDDWVYKYV